MQRVDLPAHMATAPTGPEVDPGGYWCNPDGTDCRPATSAGSWPGGPAGGREGFTQEQLQQAVMDAVSALYGGASDVLAPPWGGASQPAFPGVAPLEENKLKPNSKKSPTSKNLAESILRHIPNLEIVDDESTFKTKRQSDILQEVLRRVKEKLS